MTILHTVATPNGQRASVSLEECGIAYEPHIVDLASGEHRGEEMLKLNPFGRMPVLETDDGDVIYGSMAIALHAARESGRFLPRDAEQDAFNHWAGIIMSDLGPAFSANFYLGVLAPEKFEWGIAFYSDIIQRFLTAIDAHLADNDCFLPSGITMIDLLFYPTAATSVARIPGGLDPYPNIKRWADVIGAREAVARGMSVSS